MRISVWSSDVCSSDLIALFLTREFGDRVDDRDLHRARDGRGTDIERAAEDEREAQDVVDLVRIVGAAGGDEGIVTYGLDRFRRDLRRRIGEGSEERRAGKEWVSTGRYRWSRYNE